MSRPFLVDLGGSPEVDPLVVRDSALQAEAEGYDGVLVPETAVKPLVVKDSTPLPKAGSLARRTNWPAPFQPAAWPVVSVNMR